MVPLELGDPSAAAAETSRLGRVLGVAGWQGSGKTTLLERFIPELVAEGLAVVAVKRDAHGLALDVAGKDSDRLFRAGAEVFVESPTEGIARWRPDERGPSSASLAALERRCDVVLVEGHKGGPHPKVWLLRPGETEPPGEAVNVVAALRPEGDRLGALRELVRQRLTAAWKDATRHAGVLVGGASRRMGRPKESLVVDGMPLLTPELPRLPDAPALRGPLAGILAAMRWAPATWTIAACDLPRVREAAVDWLLAQRRPGTWAVLPRVGGEVQPLLAVYEPQALPLLEAIAADGAPAPSRLVGRPHVATPEPPAELADCWRGVNTPEELAALRRRVVP
jgi:molybdopterin-guanine dinucleotide biosynthesis protein MobB